MEDKPNQKAFLVVKWGTTILVLCSSTLLLTIPLRFDISDVWTRYIFGLFVGACLLGLVACIFIQALYENCWQNPKTFWVSLKRLQKIVGTFALIYGVGAIFMILFVPSAFVHDTPSLTLFMFGLSVQTGIFGTYLLLANFQV